MKKFLAAIACALTFNAEATQFGTDAGDAWYNATESGWGAFVIQQGDVLFISMFVYSQSQLPTWYVATSATYQGGGTYSGVLYQFTGSWFGAGFVGATPRVVGALTFTMNTTSSATVAYSVDGIQVTKSVTRFNFRTNNLNGSYMGAMSGNFSGACPIGAPTYSEDSMQMVVTHNTSTGAISLDQVSTTTGAHCVYTGTYSQTGRTGSITGTASCVPSGGGSFQVVEAETTENGLAWRFITNQAGFPGCTWNGRLGAVRRGS